MEFKIFTDEKSLSVSSLKEKDLIGRIAKIFGEQMPKSPFGAGDDCAVIDISYFEGKILSTSDAVIYARHFDERASAYEVGKKLLNRNISDIASMGGVPKFAMTSSILSKNLSLAWLDEFCEGLKDAAKKWNVLFIGGDTASVKENFFSTHINLLGEAKNPMLRTGASVGDIVFTTGLLGASFESKKHLNFTPRVEEGLFLASEKSITSCTDISDGIASDIFDILPKGASVILNSEKIPLADFPKNTLQKALCDGEDYELLFTLSKNIDKELFKKNYFEKFAVYPFEIGKIVENNSLGKSKLFLEKNEKIEEFLDSGFSH